MTFRNTTPLIAIALLLLGASACGSSGSNGGSTTATPPYAPTIVAADFTDQITNRYFPLTPGTVFTYAGTEDGVAQDNVVTVTHDTKMILGVRCVVVHDVVVTEEGQVIEDTFDWYAQDAAGNVWYFGEDTKAYKDGKVDTEGSWEAGVDGAQPGIVMETSPHVGDSYRQEYYAGEAEDMAKVLSVGESKTVTNGSYQNVILTEDFTPLDPDVIEHKYYAPDVGFIYSTIVQGGAEETQLVRITASE